MLSNAQKSAQTPTPTLPAAILVGVNPKRKKSHPEVASKKSSEEDSLEFFA
jgi:hypothetical protein